MAAPRRRAGDDRPVAQGVDLTVIDAINQYRHEADQARKERVRLNKVNRDAYLGIQDWSKKTKGQSKEFLPKTPVAVEQFSAFIKRALIQFGDWFSVEIVEGVEQLITPEQIRKLILCYLNNLPVGPQDSTSFPLVVSDGVKMGLLESLIILKVYGRNVKERKFFVEPGIPLVDAQSGQVTQGTPELKSDEVSSWRLRIDNIAAEDYYPDPTGRRLYEIHRSERDLYDVVEAAEDGIYDLAAVNSIEVDFARTEDEKRKKPEVAPDSPLAPGFRKRVVIDEFWGTILGPDGRVVTKNVLAAVANERYLIRPPEPNPFWHQESPFIAEPLLRVPLSVWHKALYDHGSPLNLALNQLFNLMLDGGIAGVWGVKQLRLDKLIEPSQVSGGIPQGETLIIDSDTPAGVKVLETVTEGEVPPDTMAVFEMLVREFNAAVLANEISLGQLPPKQVLATEIVEAQQSQAITLDALASDLESGLMKKVIRKSWLTILQNADDLSSEQVVGAIGPRAAMALLRLSPPERFALFATRCQFKVSGLSSTLGRVRDFQKYMALMQAVMVNPMLMQVFAKKFSAEKTLKWLMKSLNIDPESMEKSPEELARLGQDMREMATVFSGLAGPGSRTGGAGPSAEQTGEPALPAEINQAANPMTGMVG